MTPSERITCIRSIASALGDQEWGLIDLTLKQFSLPWTNSWQGSDKKAYLVDMIGEASDDNLLALGKHLGVASELEQVAAPAFWLPQEPRVFISHVAPFKKDATVFKKCMRMFGINGFVAHEDIEPSKEWQDEIEVALSTMDALLALLTPGFNESKWTDQEVGVAIGRRVPVIAVRVGLDPYGLIGKYQAVQGAGRKIFDICDDILTIFLQKPGIGTRITDALVRQLAASGSWSEAKKKMDYIERCQHLRPEMIKAIEKAMEENSQVREAWGVPERIKALISRTRS
jgi:hypothetical protein